MRKKENKDELSFNCTNNKNTDLYRTFNTQAHWLGNSLGAKNGKVMVTPAPCEVNFKRFGYPSMYILLLASASRDPRFNLLFLGQSRTIAYTVVPLDVYLEKKMMFSIINTLNMFKVEVLNIIWMWIDFD